jgi:hypothetical protein
VYDGGAAIDYYYVRHFLSSDLETQLGIQVSLSLSYNATGLDPLTSYTIKVRAHNNEGNGATVTDAATTII